VSEIWHASGMPWVPELFSAPVLQRVLDKQRWEEALAMPYFDGLLAGETDALVNSFAGEPELHDPVRGRIKGARALEAFVERSRAWLLERNVAVEDVERVILEERGFEEVVLHLDGGDGRVALPFALVADHTPDGRLLELRLYYTSRPLTGRPALLQRDPELREPDVVAEHQRALAAGEAEAIVATFAPDGYVREPAGQLHQGPGELRAFYDRQFAHGGGIAEEHCVLVDDGRSCALEYNVVRWGEMELPPQAGVAVYVRGESGQLAAVRVYDDVDPLAFAAALRSQPWNGA
jgi:SnoaL-like domain